MVNAKLLKLLIKLWTLCFAMHYGPECAAESFEINETFSSFGTLHNSFLSFRSLGFMSSFIFIYINLKKFYAQ